jgi:nucleoside-diphosphate-sugar epimerase
MSLPARVLVTGASGFVGRVLCRRLAESGTDVVAVDRRPHPGIAETDLRDRVKVCALIEQSRPDAVVHAGAISGGMLARDDPTLMFDVNVGGTLNVVEAMRRCGVRSLVHLSSIAVYRPRSDRSPVYEDAALGADDTYGASKVAAEQIVASYARRDEMSAWMLRVSSILGAERTTPYLISEAIDAGLSGKFIEVTDERTNMRQFIDVDDVVEAICLALDRSARGAQPVNIAGGTYVSELAIAELIRQELPALNIRVVDSKSELGDGDFGPLDIHAAADLLGFAPKAALDSRVRSLAWAAARSRDHP